MYSFISSTVLANSDEAQYTILDISKLPVNVLYSQYSEIYLTLSNPYLQNNVFIDFIALKNTLAGFTGNIVQWLGNIGNLTLPTIPALPSNNVKYVKYSDATIAGYKMDVCKIGFQIPLNYPIDLLPDLKISRPNYNTNLSLINNNCLVTVNGFLHQTDSDGTFAYIRQGANTMRKSKLNHVGILSFLDIGTVSTQPIDTTKVYSDPSDTTQSLKNKVYLYLPTPTAGQTVMLSLGGYLIYPQPGIFYQTGSNTWALHLDALPIAERYFESSQCIDLTSLKLDTTSVFADTINITQLLSDATIKLYLALSQSFWIIINTPMLRYTKMYLEHSSLPGMFVAYSNPTNPLFVGYGRMAEYWKVAEDGQWSVTINESFLHKYTFSNNPLSNQANISNANIPNMQYNMSKGYTLQIHT